MPTPTAGAPYSAHAAYVSERAKHLRPVDPSPATITVAARWCDGLTARARSA